MILKRKLFGLASWWRNANLQAQRVKDAEKARIKREEATKNKKFKEDIGLNKIWDEFKLDKLEDINKSPKIQQLSKTADCNGWDDWDYINIWSGDKDGKRYNPKWGIDYIELFYFGNADENGILKYYPDKKKVYLGKIEVTPQNFKSTLLKYLLSLINRYEAEVKEEGYESFNEDFLKLQKEIFKEVKARL